MDWLVHISDMNVRYRVKWWGDGRFLCAGYRCGNDCAKNADKSAACHGFTACAVAGTRGEIRGFYVAALPKTLEFPRLDTAVNRYRALRVASQINQRVDALVPARSPPGCIPGCPGDSPGTNAIRSAKHPVFCVSWFFAQARQCNTCS